MATSTFLQFAASAAPLDILDQSAYTADAERTGGHQVGIARNELENKVLLQVSTMCAALGDYIAHAQSNNIDDSLAISTLSGYIEQAVRNTAIMYAVGAGSADAITATFSPATSTLANGRLLIVRATASNATTTPTLNADGLGAKTIVKGNNLPLDIGDISGAGYHIIVSYDSGLDKYVLNNPARGINSIQMPRQILQAADIKPSGTDGGTFTKNTWQQRTLNTLQSNTIAGASLASNRITLPEGMYFIRARAIGFNVNRHQIVLNGVSGDTGTLMVGSSANTNNADTSSTAPVGTDSTINGVLFLSQTTTFEILHQCGETQNSKGLGSACGFGVSENYASITVERFLDPTVYPWILTKEITFAISSFTGSVAGVGVVESARFPFPVTVTKVSACCDQTDAVDPLTLQIKNGSDNVLSSALSLAASGFYAETAAIDDNYKTIDAGDKLSIEVTAANAMTGCKVTVQYT